MPQPDSGLILRARVVLPVFRQPIDNGAVFVSGQRIVSVGPFADLIPPAGTPIVDLGDSVLLPGLVNAHCHLDFTDLGGSLARGSSFTDWIRRIVKAKAGWSESDYARSWTRGAEMLLASGVTSVADIESVPALLPGVWNETPLRIWSFLEMTGVADRSSPDDILRDARATIDRAAGGRGRVGFSPHSMYSTVPGLAAASMVAAGELDLRVTMHLAESNEEFEMFRNASGELFSWLEELGRDMGDCGRATPVQLAHACRALNERMFAVHVNRLGPEDAALLGDGGVSVVHCPRSHEFFGHSPFEFSKLAAAGVNVCLGTDSLASVGMENGEPPVLSMFSEMRRFARVFPEAAPETILQLATENGARALGMAGQAGALHEGALADLIAIPFSGGTTDAADAVVHYSGTVSGSMIGGEWAKSPRID